MSTQARVESHADPRSAIVEAAAELLREGGMAGVTTRSVAHAAGVPAPTIFRVFGDKDGLMDAVAEHVMATYVSVKSEVASHTDGDPVEALRDAWAAHVDFGLANPDLYVLLSTPGRLGASPSTDDGIGVLGARVARLAAAGLLAVPEEQVVDLVHAAGTGAVFALLQRSPDERDTSLADTMLDAVLRVVLTTTPAPPASDLAPLAIAFRAAVPGLDELTAAERGLMAEWVTRAIDARAQSSGAGHIRPRAGVGPSKTIPDGRTP